MMQAGSDPNGVRNWDKVPRLNVHNKLNTLKRIAKNCQCASISKFEEFKVCDLANQKNDFGDSYVSPKSS